MNLTRMGHVEWQFRIISNISIHNNDLTTKADIRIIMTLSETYSSVESETFPSIIIIPFFVQILCASKLTICSIAAINYHVEKNGLK